MIFSNWVLYTLAVLVLTASSGPSVFLCLSKSITEGFRASVFAALGSLTAIIGIITLSFTGLGVLVASSEFVFNCVKWCGAGYLVYLGIKAFTTPRGQAPHRKHISNICSICSATFVKDR